MVPFEDLQKHLDTLPEHRTVEEIYIKKARLITEFNLEDLQQMKTVQELIRLGYLRCKKQLSVFFNTRKGLLHQIKITATGNQKEKLNIIALDPELMKKGSFPKALIQVYHSNLYGILITVDGKIIFSPEK